MFRKFRRIIIILLIITSFIAIGVYKFTEGNPREFITNFRNAATMIDSHHTDIESINKFSWMIINDPVQMTKTIDFSFGYTEKQPKSFLLIADGTFSVTGGYASGNQPNKPVKIKSVGFGMIPLKTGGKISGSSWGAKSIDFNKLRKLGTVHTLPFPIGKIVWFLLYDINGISQRKLILTIVGFTIVSLLLYRLIRRELNYEQIDL